MDYDIPTDEPGQQSQEQQMQSISQQIEQATHTQSRLDHQIQQQQTSDDADLAELKAKMKEMKATPKPQNKDTMIDFLRKRIQQAKEAIQLNEAVIERERTQRKAVSQEVKQSNQILSQIIHTERNLADRVNRELEATLERAVKEKFDI